MTAEGVQNFAVTPGDVIDLALISVHRKESYKWTRLKDNIITDMNHDTLPTHLTSLNIII